MSERLEGSGEESPGLSADAFERLESLEAANNDLRAAQIIIENTVRQNSIAAADVWRQLLRLGQVVWLSARNVTAYHVQTMAGSRRVDDAGSRNWRAGEHIIGNDIEYGPYELRSVRDQHVRFVEPGALRDAREYSAHVTDISVHRPPPDLRIVEDPTQNTLPIVGDMDEVA